MTPPTRFGLFRIIVRMGWRRFLNRYGSKFKRLGRKKEAARTGELGRSRKSLSFKLFLVFIVALAIGTYSFMAASKLAGWSAGNAAKEAGKVPVPTSTYRWLKDSFAGKDVDHILETHLRRKKDEINRWGTSLEELDALRAEGDIERFAPVPETLASLRAQPDARDWYRKGAAFVLFAGGLGFLFLGLGTGNQDLGKVEWQFGSLFHYPARTGDLLLARITEYFTTSTQALAGFGFICTAFGIALGAPLILAIPMGVFAGFSLVLLLSAVRLGIELLLRRAGNFHRLKNAQALFSLLGLVFFYGVLAVVMAVEVPRWFDRIIEVLPDLSTVPPFGLAVSMLGNLDRPAVVLGSALGLILLPVITIFLVVRFGTQLLRGGVSSKAAGRTSEQRSARDATASRSSSVKRWPVLRKELKRILRDRAFLFQIAAAPLAIILFNLAVNPALADVTEGSTRKTSMVAFYVAAYVMFFGSSGILFHEKPALGYLATLPRGLERAVREKIILWIGVGAIYALFALTLFAVRGGMPDSWQAPLTVIAGVPLFGWIAGSMGILASRPWEEEKHRQMRPATLYLFFLLAALFAGSFLGPSVWNRVTTLFLFFLVAASLWHRARLFLPYALEKTERPASQIHLSDGLVGVLIFQVIQSSIARFQTMPLPEDVEKPMALMAEPLSYLIGVFAATTGLTLFFALRRVPGWLRECGFRIRPETGWAKCAGWIMGGILAALLVGFFRGKMGNESASDLSWLPLSLLLVIPYEFLFRGVLFAGLRKVFSTWIAILFGGLVFAVVHPVAVFWPMLGLGLLTCLVFSRTRLLVAVFLIHGAYLIGSVLPF